MHCFFVMARGTFSVSLSAQFRFRVENFFSSISFDMQIF